MSLRRWKANAISQVVETARTQGGDLIGSPPLKDDLGSGDHIKFKRDVCAEKALDSYGFLCCAIHDFKTHCMVYFTFVAPWSLQI